MAFGVKVIFEPGIRYIIGNFTLGGQLIGGGISLGKGIASFTDAAYTPLPHAKLLYCLGGSCQILGGSTMVIGTCLNTIVPWSIPATTVVGESLRYGGSYCVKCANAMNPLPAASKVVDLIPDVG